MKSRKQPQPRIVRCRDCTHYPEGGAKRGECVLDGVMVNGSTKNRPCFRRRKEKPL